MEGGWTRQLERRWVRPWLRGYWFETKTAMAALRAERSGVGLPRRRFVIFGQGRTGSTLLCDLLRSHPQVVCDEEILGRRVRDPIGHAANCARVALARHGSDACAAYGFKVKIYQLTAEQGIGDVGAYLARMVDEGWSIVYLWRRNLLRHALSNVLSDQMGRTYLRGQERRNAAGKLVADPNDVIARMERRAALGEAEARALEGIESLPLVYEDDLSEPEAQQATVDRVVEMLGLARARVGSDLVRMSPRGLDALVENADALRAAMEGAGWSSYLD